MPRIKTVRKASEEGRPLTLWMRRGVVQRAEREARKARKSLSQFVNETLAEKFDDLDQAAEQQSAA